MASALQCLCFDCTAIDRPHRILFAPAVLAPPLIRRRSALLRSTLQHPTFAKEEIIPHHSPGSICSDSLANNVLDVQGADLLTGSGGGDAGGAEGCASEDGHYLSGRGWVWV